LSDTSKKTSNYVRMLVIIEEFNDHL